ncbi:MAG TPA: hypothetical protein VHO70_19090 [Chitinispirillaceae bacterium]|nr:hypothetical protein [Chitinispirillaceae bacterium]
MEKNDVQRDIGKRKFVKKFEVQGGVCCNMFLKMRRLSSQKRNDIYFTQKTYSGQKGVS